jgi:hypothetical protein
MLRRDLIAPGRSVNICMGPAGTRFYAYFYGVPNHVFQSFAPCNGLGGLYGVRRDRFGWDHLFRQFS